MLVNNRRISILRKDSPSPGPVVLWMSRDQRVNDNWSFVFAQELATIQKVPLAVVFCLVPQFLGATTRQYGFMLKGLQYVEQDLSNKDVPFFLLTGFPGEEIPKFIKKYRASALIADLIR